MGKLKALLTACLGCFGPLFAGSGQVVKGNGIDIWHETFGNKKDPAVLLVMGALCQGILWPTEFCQKLSKEGFYVIRYDHRDTGLSSCFNFEENPYSLLDMAKDGVALLDHLGVKEAHVCGLSTGGPIAQLMSVHFPERISTLTLISTSPDFRPSSLAWEGEYPADITLSRPKEIYINWMHKFLSAPPQTFEEQLEGRMECWSILNGTCVPFEEELYREIHRKFLERLRHPESMTNHLLAIKESFDFISATPLEVKVPTTIIHGSEDTIFPPDHGEALHAMISHSRYVPVQGMGHVLNSRFYDLIIQEIKSLRGK